MLVLALVAVLVFASGFALSHRGAPYSTLLVTGHKLGALGSVVLLTLAFTTSLATAVTAWPVWTLSGVTAVLVVALFASGALLSGSRSPAPAWGRIHRIAPFLLAASGLALILLTT